MISKVWLIWEVGSGLVALALWLLPKPVADLIKTGDNLTWWIANGKWVGFGIFGFVTVFLAPFLAWKTEFHGKETESNARIEVEKQLQEEKRKNNPRFVEHCEELGEAAFELAKDVDYLLALKDSPNATFRGDLIHGIQVNKPGQIELVKVSYTFNMQYLEKHLQLDEEYPLDNVGLTTDVATPALYKRLSILADSRAFDLVPTCPVCKALMR
jgi:hypothetical protein